MRVHILIISDDIKHKYSINDDYADTKGFVYFENTKAIYGLIQSGALAHTDINSTWQSSIISLTNAPTDCGITKHKKQHPHWW